MNRILKSTLSLLAIAGIGAALLAGDPQGVAQAQRNVPIFGQRWSPWANDRLGFGPAGSTIGRYGCAVTSAAMIRSYFSGYIDPRGMNNWLRAHNGFDRQYGDLIIFRNVPGFNGSRDYSRVTADLPFINWLLDHGYLVIAGTRFPPSRTQTHFVVLTGHVGNTYFMNDPWTGAKNVNFSAYYGDPGRWIYGINIYGR